MGFLLLRSISSFFGWWIEIERRGRRSQQQWQHLHREPCDQSPIWCHWQEPHKAATISLESSRGRAVHALAWCFKKCGLLLGSPCLCRTQNHRGRLCGPCGWFCFWGYCWAGTIFLTHIKLPRVTMRKTTLVFVRCNREQVTSASLIPSTKARWLSAVALKVRFA